MKSERVFTGIYKAGDEVMNEEGMMGGAKTDMKEETEACMVVQIKIMPKKRFI